MLTVAIPKRNKLQNIIVLTPKDGAKIYRLRYDTGIIIIWTAEVAWQTQKRA